MQARQVLIHLYNETNNNWLEIYDFISQKKKLPETLNLKGEEELITIIDSNYPDYLKNIFKPPFVITKKEAKKYEMKDYEIVIKYHVAAHTHEEAKSLAITNASEIEDFEVVSVRQSK